MVYTKAKRLWSPASAWRRWLSPFSKIQAYCSCRFCRPLKDVHITAALERVVLPYAKLIQSNVVLLLILYILSYRCFVQPHRWNIVPFCPEVPIPKFACLSNISKALFQSSHETWHSFPVVYLPVDARDPASCALPVFPLPCTRTIFGWFPSSPAGILCRLFFSGTLDKTRCGTCTLIWYAPSCLFGLPYTSTHLSAAISLNTLIVSAWWVFV